MDCFIVSPKTFSFRFMEEEKKLLINDMTFHLRGFLSPFSVDHRRGGGGVRLQEDSVGSTELTWRFWGRQAAEVGPRVLPGGPHLTALQPRGHGAASTASLRPSCSWCCWQQARRAWSCAQFTAFLHTDWAPSIWSLTAVAITPFGSNYCLELVNYWLAMRLLDWLFSKNR